MDRYHVFSTDDMINWTDHGEILSSDQVPWGRKEGGFMWAPDCAYRNGTYYFYFPHPSETDWNDSWKIGVATSDKPAEGFKVQGYIEGMDPMIDPCVFVDDDGQAYMYWGNPNLYGVKLNRDMISYDGEIIQFPKIKDYQEGPWMYKHGDHYYLAFASTCCPEGIGYAMSDSPLGPWKYAGHIMDHTPRTRGNHPGIIDYKGKSYCFGLNYDVFRLSESRHAERRSVSAAEMEYNPDGTIRELPYFLECKLEQIEPFSPYREVEAETMAWGYGLKTEPANPWARGAWNQLVTDIDDSEYIMLRGVDFGKGAKEFSIDAMSHLYGGNIEIRTDSPDGPLAGIVEVGCTKDEMQRFTTPVKGLKGVHDLYLVFRGRDIQKKNLFKLDRWSFK